MDKILNDFENLKISAFLKYSKLTGNINNVTIGPNSSKVQDITHNEEKEKTPSKTNRAKKSLKKEKTPIKSPLPLKHVLDDIEVERREKVQEALDDRYNKFELFTKAQKKEKENQWLLRQQAFIHNVEENEQMILKTLNEQDLNKSKQNEKLVKHYQEMIQRKLQYEQHLERQKEKQRILNENIEKIKKCQLEFRTIYQDITVITKSCVSLEELKKMLGDNFKLFRSLLESFDEIISKCRSCSVDEEQLSKAASVLNQVKNFKTLVEECVSRINTKKKQEQARALAPPSTPVKEERVVQIPGEIKSTETGSSQLLSLSQCVSASNLKKYVELQQFVAQHTQLFKELLQSDQLKQFRFDCKKAVNIPVNAISAVSAEHLRDKCVKLYNLLAGKTVPVADKQVNASRHPQGIPFCMDLLAKKFVLQGDLMISSNPEAAFCYATIIISLWNDFPDFGKLLLGCFYNECPYLVPFYIPKTEEQTMEQYYVSLGYRYVDGQIEKQDKFLKRMTGISRLYFAIMVAKPKRGQSKNPHDIKNAWHFLTSILKLEPQLDITATILHTFLETVGFEMEAVYGMAFRKLVIIIMEKFMPSLKKIDTGGPVTRLEVLFQEYKTKGHFDRPDGILETNFW